LPTSIEPRTTEADARQLLPEVEARAGAAFSLADDARTFFFTGAGAAAPDGRRPARPVSATSGSSESEAEAVSCSTKSARLSTSSSSAPLPPWSDDESTRRRERRERRWLLEAVGVAAGWDDRAGLDEGSARAGQGAATLKAGEPLARTGPWRPTRIVALGDLGQPLDEVGSSNVKSLRAEARVGRVKRAGRGELELLDSRRADAGLLERARRSRELDVKEGSLARDLEQANEGRRRQAREQHRVRSHSSDAA
jgi:hypothetical protein